MRPRLLFLEAAILGGLLLLYFAGYGLLGHRDSGRARGAGEYFHYRDFDHASEVYLFLPAAYLEAQMIQVHPAPFCVNPSWATEPQRLVIRATEDDTTRFWFPPFK